MISEIYIPNIYLLFVDGVALVFFKIIFHIANRFHVAVRLII